MKKQLREHQLRRILSPYEVGTPKLIHQLSIKKTEPVKFRVCKRRHNKLQRSVSKVEVVDSSSIGHTFSVAKGNNHQLVASVFEAHNWQPTNRVNLANLLWVQDNRRINFTEVSKNKTIVNMFECHDQLTNKQLLYANMRNYLKSKGQTINVMPITFSINFSRSHLQVTNSLHEFLEYYIANHPKGEKLRLKGSFSFIREDRQYNIKYKDIEVKAYSQPYDSKYIWIFKPANKNRGCGIKLFSKLKTLEELLSSEMFSLNMYTTQSEQQSFVIQKYIENPLLIDGRKFDIRVWSMIDSKNQLYFFKEGYLRLSGYPFTLKKEDLGNSFVHLTNNAIQKNSDQYGRYEEGNQMSFQDFEAHLKSVGSQLDFLDIQRRIKEVVGMTYHATNQTINPKNRRNCFQLFGYDFMIDVDGKLWLLQVNCNPCLEESSELLRKLIPRLLTETLQIVQKEFKGGYFQQLL